MVNLVEETDRSILADHQVNEEMNDSIDKAKKLDSEKINVKPKEIIGKEENVKNMKEIKETGWGAIYAIASNSEGINQETPWGDITWGIIPTAFDGCYPPSNTPSRKNIIEEGLGAVHETSTVENDITLNEAESKRLKGEKDVRKPSIQEQITKKSVSETPEEAVKLCAVDDQSSGELE